MYRGTEKLQCQAYSKSCYTIEHRLFSVFTYIIYIYYTYYFYIYIYSIHIYNIHHISRRIFGDDLPSLLGCVCCHGMAQTLTHVGRVYFASPGLSQWLRARAPASRRDLPCSLNQHRHGYDWLWVNTSNRIS